ncbi:MAG: cytochrome c [Flavobacteriales bacterium]|nr:cytochrome c [Flavobacteriales bacterium]
MRNTALLLGAITALLIACGNSEADSRASLAPAEGGAPKGEQLFRMHCVLCHGSTGKLGFNGAKDLTLSVLSRAEMITRVSEGKGTMQPYKQMLTPKEIEAVVDHVRALAVKP